MATDAAGLLIVEASTQRVGADQICQEKGCATQEQQQQPLEHPNRTAANEQLIGSPLLDPASAARPRTIHPASRLDGPKIGKATKSTIAVAIGAQTRRKAQAQL